MIPPRWFILIPVMAIASAPGCAQTPRPTISEVASVVYPVQQSPAGERHGNIGVNVRIKMNQNGTIREHQWDGDLQRDDPYEVNFHPKTPSPYTLSGRFEFGRPHGNPDVLILTLKHNETEIARFSTVLEFK